jgi:hypothetical protein
MPTADHHNNTSTRRNALRISAAGFGAPAVAFAAPGADAELIRLCNLLIANQREIEALLKVRKTVADERRTEPQLGELSDNEENFVDRIIDLPEISTLAGARAMARASLAIAPRDSDGSITMEDRSECLVWSVAEFLAGETWHEHAPSNDITSHCPWTWYRGNHHGHVRLGNISAEQGRPSDRAMRRSASL